MTRGPRRSRGRGRGGIVTNRSSFAAVLGGAALLSAAALSSGCGPSRPRTAEEVVKRMSDRLASAQSFTFSTDEKHQRRRSVKVVDIARSRTFTVQRPGAIAFKTVGGEMG